MTRSKTIVRPPKLGPGSRVAIVAPSGPCLEPDDLARAVELCERLGFVAQPGSHALDRLGYLAGTDAHRLRDLNVALRDPDVQAVWCLRGGYGVTRILDQVDYGALDSAPKAVIGYSDITALLQAITATTGLVTFPGPTARQAMPSFTRRHFEKILCHATAAGRLEHLPAGTDVLVPREPRVLTLTPGRAEGRLFGGNLALLQCLIGTPYMPDLRGAILFLEDVNEAHYRIDRMLAHLRMASALDGVAGIAIGRFSEVPSDGDGGLGLHEVLSAHLGPLGVPVAYGLPVGHIPEQWTLPIGVRARLDAAAGELEILEPAVS